MNPAILRWARESAGYEIPHVAHRLGKESGLVQALESGHANPTIGQLKALARIYRRPLAALLLPEPPTQPPALVDFRTLAGGGGRPLSVLSRFQVRRARLLQARATELYPLMGLRPSVTIGSAHTRDDPEELAAGVRSSLRITVEDQASWEDDYRAYRGWRQAIEAKHILVLQMTLSLEELRGFSLARGAVPTIVVSSADEPRPRIFTLFHEYAHLLLGTGGICLPQPGRAVAGRRSVERFCNCFAGALLVPKQALLAHPRTQELRAITEAPPDTALDPLAATFRVSPPVIWMRLRQTEVISSAVSQEKWAQWESRRARVTKKRLRRSDARQPRARTRFHEGGAYVSIVLEAHDRDLIGYPETLDYLDIRSRDFEKVAYLVGRGGA